MRKLLLQGAILSFLTLAFIACDSDDGEPWVEPEVTTTGVYILNSGTNNDATLSYYDIDKKTLTTDVFYNMNNNQKLGDLAQDMVIYGSKMYITVTRSNNIFVTDLSAKILYTIEPTIMVKDENGKDKSQPLEPRYTKAYNGKVYVTTETGYLLRIDTTSMAVDKIKIGSYPEQMTIVKGNLYVTNSREKNDSISIVNLSTFKKTGIIKVAINPDMITSDKYNNIYVISQGNYTTVKPALQKINPDTKAVTVIGTDVATQMTVNGDKLYLLYVDYVNPVKLSYYDITQNKIVNESFVTPPSATALDNAYNISFDPGNGDIYITTAAYQVKGGVYVFSADGTYKTNFASGGYYPMGAFFLTETK